MRKETLKSANPNLFVSVILSTAFCIFAFACNQHPEITNAPQGMQLNDSAKKKFTAAMVDNRKDPNCGMPVTAGIEDTVHYNGKVYGFCSDECKQAFLKNPSGLAKNADLK
jgi:YHS domain-containing protein